MFGRAWLFALSLVFCAPASCVCNADECGSTESANLTFVAAAEELDGAQAIACRNDTCQTLSLQPIAAGAVTAAKQTSLPVVTPSPSGTLSVVGLVRATTDGFAFSFVWDIADSDDVRTGDELSVRMLGPQGDELLAKAGRVGSVSRDTSDDCGPTCLNAGVNLDE